MTSRAQELCEHHYAAESDGDEIRIVCPKCGFNYICTQPFYEAVKKHGILKEDRVVR